MIRFLRLFPQYRALENDRDATVVMLREATQQLTTEKLLLQDRLDAVMNDRSELWRMMEKAIDAERASYQMHVNVQWQRSGQGVPYPDAPHVPPQSIPANRQEPIARRELPSEAVARVTQKFYREMAESLNS